MNEENRGQNPELTPRQQMILAHIVRDHVQEGSPISSRLLVERHNLDMSSATVRNEMMVLEQTGLIQSPHTSAGRIPTEAGYRYFVRRLLDDTAGLSVVERRTIAHQFYQAQHDMEQWMRLAAATLARSSEGAALVTSPQVVENRFKHMELIATQGRLVLMVLVMGSGDVSQQVLNLAEPVSQEHLSQAAERINDVCAGLKADQIRARARQMPLLEQEVTTLAADLMEGLGGEARIVYREGLPQLLPAFGEDSIEGVAQALHFFEERPFLDAILQETLGPEIGGVHVLIGGEGRWEELSECSMVLSRYGVMGQVTGALGVLGPLHMSYGRAISAVRYIAGLLSDFLYDLYVPGGER